MRRPAAGVRKCSIERLASTTANVRARGRRGCDVGHRHSAPCGRSRSHSARRQERANLVHPFLEAGSMSVRIRNIALLVLVTSTAGYAGLQFASQPPSYVNPASRPWIPPPRTGMDASSEAVRTLIARLSDSLAASCSEDPEASRGERYVLGIGRDPWARRWGIDVSVRGSVIEAAIGHAAGMPTSPPPPPGIPYESDDGARRPPLRITLTHAQMQHISDAWNDEGLWHAPQQTNAFHCADGRLISLESCVDGRYHARMRHCGGQTGAGTERLWKAVSPLLPTSRNE